MKQTNQLRNWSDILAEGFMADRILETRDYQLSTILYMDKEKVERVEAYESELKRKKALNKYDF